MVETIDIDGVKLAYERTGQGSPMILMHGWGCTHQTVASIAAIASQHHTVYNIDFPGFGDSPEPPTVWGVEQYTRLVEEFARRLGIESPVLLGHSFGGRVGLLYASRNRVSKLILVDGAGLKPKRSLKYYFKVYSFKASKKLMQLVYGREKAAAKIEEQRQKRGSADYRNATPLMRSILSKCVNEDLTPIVGNIQAPTLLIWGENDTATPIYMARRLEQLIPDAGLVSFPGCGHYSFLDNPGQFAAVLHSFLNS